MREVVVLHISNLEEEVTPTSDEVAVVVAVQVLMQNSKVAENSSRGLPTIRHDLH